MAPISGDYSYRDQWQQTLANSGSTGSTEETGKTDQNWDAVFTDKKTNMVSVDDFLTLMVAQLRNQDFMNPVDDTQYVTQLAQFATMTQMQEMAGNMKNNYVMSLVGKNVTAARFSVSGDLVKEVGTVTKISLVDNEYAVYVNGKKFSLEQIMEINNTPSSGGTGGTDGTDTDKDDLSKKNYLASLIGKTVTIHAKDSEGDMDEIIGVVKKTSTEDGEYRVYVDGKWYDMDSITRVESTEVEEEEPEKPVDPSDPSKPTDPSDPTDPVDPPDTTEPTQPTDPVEPEVPVDPVDPPDTTEPTEPETPTEPTEP